ncbi:MAG: D-alanyl-D-alanine carboxypeptidase/D-alanyl-D-alanine-endopeptidase [Prevotellaceae bacterium]|nr:D-alanyl-D-alanine carboxypeptidase/D-alanyl-D-alanine-endopeptidase [Prevotellaceae bacterium]
MRKITLLALAMLFLLPNISVAQKKQRIISNEAKAPLVNYVEELKTRDTVLHHALWGIKVMNPANGDVVVSYNEDASMSPASNMKLVTTGLTLLTLGPDYRYETHLKYDGEIVSDSTLTGNIYIVGGGDPTLGSAAFLQAAPDSVFSYWAKALKDAGIRQITGSIIVDPTTVFDDEYRPSTWALGDITTGYGSGLSGLQFSDNFFNVTIVPGAKEGEPALIKNVVPYIPNVAFESYITTVKADSISSVNVVSSPSSPRIIMTGTMALNRKEYVRTIAMPDPAYVCAWHFNQYLNWNGVATSGNIQVYHIKAPVDTKELFTISTYYSPEMREVVKETNKVSNNGYAESLLKIVAYEQEGVGSRWVGTNLFTEILKNEGLNVRGITLSDGSGLSRKDMLNPAFICDFLGMMKKTAVYEIFNESLSIAGVDGTLKNMLKGTAAEGNLRAKSGTLSDARAYSGYVTTKGGQELVFSIIMNNYKYGREVTQRLEKLMRLVSEIQ